MRIFWSLVLATGLLLTAYDVFDGHRRDGRTPTVTQQNEGTQSLTLPENARCEDGTGMPPP